jgi:hypothetical protein
MYGEVCGLLGVERHVFEVRPFEPLPSLGRRWDLVTALLLWFNTTARNGVEVPWGVDEWTYFMDDLVANQLRPGGHCYLTLGNRDRHGELPPEVHAMFLRRGVELRKCSRILPEAAG